jgi:glycosyltransferase involved in cell wall biosynthesis
MPVGGAENLILTSIQQLDPNRFSSVLCCIQTKDILGEEAEQMGVHVIELGRLKTKGYDRKIVGDILSLVRREKIDIIHCHLYHAAMYGRLAARIARIPAIVTVHNVYARPKWHRRMINRWLGAKTAKIIAVSEAVGKDIIHFDHAAPERVVVIPNGIDIKAAQSALTRDESRQNLRISRETKVIGCIGRLEEQKGHFFLLEALSTLRQKEGDCPHLLVVGDGSYKTLINERIEQLCLEDRVTMLGMRRDIADILNAIDLFVMPSLWEGLPLALLEAMAAGIPVIASKVGGVGEVLGQSEFGIALPPGNVAALSQSIASLMADPEHRATIGARGAARVRERYSSQAMVSHLESIYQNAKMNDKRP